MKWTFISDVWYVQLVQIGCKFRTLSDFFTDFTVKYHMYSILKFIIFPLVQLAYLHLRCLNYTLGSWSCWNISSPTATSVYGRAEHKCNKTSANLVPLLQGHGQIKVSQALGWSPESVPGLQIFRLFRQLLQGQLMLIEFQMLHFWRPFT